MIYFDIGDEMLKTGDIVVDTNNIKYVVIGYNKFTPHDTVFRLFTDNFMDKLYNAKAIFYPVSALDKPLMESLAKQRSYFFDSVKVIGKMNINPFLIKSQMILGTQLALLSDADMLELIKQPLSLAKELETRLRKYPENEKYRYLNILNQHEIKENHCVEDLNYFIDNDFNVLYYKDYKFYKVGKVKGKTLADKYFNLLTHEYVEFRDGIVEKYEPKLDFYFQKKNKILEYNNYMFVFE